MSSPEREKEKEALQSLMEFIKENYEVDIKNKNKEIKDECVRDEYTRE